MRTGCALVDSVSFVCVLCSFATQPMSPGYNRGTSTRSRPSGTDRCIIFSAVSRVALYTSCPATPCR